MNPETWNKVHKKYNMLTFGAIVSYNNITFMNASLEKQFSNVISIKACHTLKEAIEWVLTKEYSNS